MTDAPAPDAAAAAPATTSPDPAAAPVFGSASTFGGGTGFAGFTAAAAAATRASGDGAAAGDDGGDGDGAADEEECQAEFKPVVQLAEVETVSGEEGEEAWIDLKSKLYRFDHDASEWKERGVGQTRLLRSTATDRVRLLFRQEKTLKVRANHIVLPGTKLAPHSGSDKAFVWSAVDFADGEQKPELFCVRFASPERAAEFKAKFDEAMAHNEAALGADAGGAEEGGEGEGGEGKAEAAAPPAGDDKKEAAAADADALAGEVAAKASVKEEEAKE